MNYEITARTQNNRTQVVRAAASPGGSRVYNAEYVYVNHYHLTLTTISNAVIDSPSSN